jgi:hypothetical protein
MCFAVMSVDGAGKSGAQDLDGLALTGVEKGERFLDCASQLLRSQRKEKKKRRLAPPAMTAMSLRLKLKVKTTVDSGPPLGD